MFHDFITLIRRFLPPYWGSLALNILFNLLATVLSLFSFAAIIPVLQILFGIAPAPDTLEPFSFHALASGQISFSELPLALSEALWGKGLGERGSGTVLLLLGLILLFLTFLKCLCQWLGEFFMIPIRTGVVRDLRFSLFRRVLSLPLGYFTDERKGDVMSRMTSDVAEVEASVMSSLNMLFRDPLMIVVYLTWLFVLSWQLTLFVLVLLPTAGWAIGAIGRSLKRRSTHAQEQTGMLLSLIEETLGGLRVVKAFSAERFLLGRFAGLNDDTRRTLIRLNRRYTLAHPVSEFLGTAMIALLLWYGGGLILSDRSAIDAATFIYYLVIFYSIINPAKDLTKAAYAIRKGMASLDRIDRILSARPEPGAGDTAGSVPGNVSSPDPQCALASTQAPSISFSHVSFSYQQGVEVLRDINLKVEAGSTVALVGQSGSGKTTLADLIPRFYEVTSGSITIACPELVERSCPELVERDIRDIPLSDLRRWMGIVPQDPILFNDTFFANITFGLDTSVPPEGGGTWMEAVRRAATMANAHEFISATPDGYATLVGDRGCRLSGGQRQRISIARALLRNPPILILDEATSALDAESEALVQQALLRLMANRTTLVIAHRLSTIRHADLICVLDNGQIVERGTHSELLKLNGHYAKLLKMQGS